MKEISPEQELRKAAERIREVAGKAPAGPWSLDGELVISSPDRDPVVNVYDGYGTESAAVHIALWDPTTALLVADVFDKWARMGEMDADLLHRVGGPETLTLARAILGGPS